VRIRNKFGLIGKEDIMQGVEEIMKKAESLSVAERVLLVDSLLRKLNPPDTDIEKEWMEVARRRLAHLRSGSVHAVPGNDVFMTIRERFEK
jgi:hypothetical protein